MFAVDTATEDSPVAYILTAGRVFLWAGGRMRGIKISQQEFALKMQGGEGMREGGAYLRDTTVYDRLHTMLGTSNIHTLHC